MLKVTSKLVNNPTVEHLDNYGHTASPVLSFEIFDKVNRIRSKRLHTKKIIHQTGSINPTGSKVMLA